MVLTMLATRSPRVQYYTATRQACTKSGVRPSRRCTLFKLVVRMASSEARIVSLEASQNQQDKDIAYLQYKAATNQENVKALRTTDNALLQVVGKRGLHYANRFETLLQEFKTAIDPLRKDMTALKEAQRADMTALKEAQRTDMTAIKEAQTSLKADNTVLKAIGGFVVTALGLVVALYEAGFKNIPGMRRAVGVIAAFVFVAAISWQFYQMQQEMSKLQKQVAKGLPNVAEDLSKLETQTA